MRRVGWGIAGCGWVARDYVAPALAEAANGHIVALLDPDPRALAEVGRGAPEANATADLERFLTTPGLDAVYVAAPNHLHRPICEAAAAHGLHVLCEKPMALDLEDAEVMVRACAEAEVLYATAFDQRFHAAHRRLRELVAEGALGTVTAVRIHYACWLPPNWRPETGTADGYDNWRADPTRAGGGALFDLAPHGLDLAQRLLDDDLCEVACLGQRRVFGYAVEDGAALLGRFREGALLVHHVAYNTPDAFPRRRLELVGTEAMALATDTMGQTPGGTLELVHAGGARQAVPIAPEEDRSPFLGQAEAFADAVLGVRPFAFAAERDLATMRLLETAQRQLAAGLAASGPLAVGGP